MSFSSARAHEFCFRCLPLEIAPLPRLTREEIEDADAFELPEPMRSRRKRSTRPRRAWSPPDHRTRLEEFKCGHCRMFVGPPLSGGRHRNHCPTCLYSKHVDRTRPGDRLSDCGSLMQPISTVFRSDGEQMVVHHCLGCHTERRCRAAADDHPIVFMRLPIVTAWKGRQLAAIAERVEPAEESA